MTTSNIAQQAIFSRIVDILHQQIGDEEQITLETDLLNDLGIESLELVELGLQLEKEFGRKIPITELRKCVTIEDVVQVVQEGAGTGQAESVS